MSSPPPTGLPLLRARPVLLFAAGLLLLVTGCGGVETGGIKPPAGTSQSTFERQLNEASKGHCRRLPRDAAANPAAAG